MLKAAKAYLSTQVTTATQGDLLLMLYDTAIKHLKQAKEKMALRDYAAKGTLISKAIEIVSELHESLNREKGGEVAKNLSKMYFICNTRLLQANLHMDQSKVDEVITILSGLRQAFAQIIPGHEGMAPASQSAVVSQGAKPAAPSAPSYPQAATAQQYAPQAMAPQPLAPQPQLVLPAPGEQAPAAPEAPAAPQGPAPAPERSPVNQARFRAANAYANSH